MPSLQVLSAPQNQPTLNPKVVTNPVQPQLAPKVVAKPVQPALAPKVVTEPARPQLAPQVVTQPAQPQINVDNTPRFAKLGDLVKAKYPGVYDQLDSGVLGKIVATKYPGAYDQLIEPAYTPAPETPKQGLGLKDTAKELLKFTLTGGLAPNEISKGILKGIGSTVAHTAQLGTKALETLTGMNSGTDQLGKKVIEKTKPTNTAQKLGFYGEQAGEFFLPGGAVNKAGKVLEAGAEGLKLGSKATSALKLASKVGLGAAESAAMTAAQGGDAHDVKNAAIFGGAFPIATKAIAKLGTAAKEVAKFSASALSGVPKDAIEYALKNPKQVQTAIKRAAQEGGDIAAQRISQNALDALDELKNARRLNFQAGLSKLEKEATYSKNGQLYVKRILSDAEAAATKGYKPGTVIGVPTNLSTKGIKQVTTTTLKEYGINAKGRFIDWSEAAIDNAHGKKLQELVKRVYDWSDYTPTSLNKLRRVIDGYKEGGINLGSSEKQFNSIIASMRENLSGYLGKRVPQVAEMNAKYKAESEVIDAIRKQLKLGSNDPNTALRKLINVFNPKSQVYRPVVQQLGEKAGVDLMSDIAALTMLQWTPEGLGKYLAGLSSGAGIGLGLINPAALATLPVTAAMSSPKLVGKAATTLGKIGESEVVQTIKKAAPKIGIGLGNQAIR